MVDLHIERLAYGPDAIARLADGRTAFVSGGVPGDHVSAEIVSEKDRYVNARVLHVTEPSEHRVTPPCPYFGICGGCSWQHVDYAMQLEAKRSSVVDALQRIGGVSDARDLVTETVPSKHEYGYRNKIELVADPDAQRLTLGFHRAGSEQVVPVDACLLLPKALRKAPKALTGALRFLSGDSDLGIRRVAVRAGAHTRDVEIAIWTSPGPFPRAIAATMLSKAMQTTSIVRVINRGTDKERDVRGVETLSGKGAWHERVAGMSYAVSAPSFFQVNTPGAEKLVELVLAALEADGSDRVLDLYAGAGTFTLPLAAVAGDVEAVESSGPAVRDLRRNLEANELWADVIGGDAAREVSSAGRCELAVVDPPRAGLHEHVIASLAADVRPRVIAYVSCDPATLARDVKRFAESGYRLTGATPVDLFPQTFHVETVARLERASS